MTPYNSVILQNDNNNLARWANTSQTQFNVTKRHIMRISRKKESLMTDYYIDGQTLFTVKKNPSVGVMLSNDGVRPSALWIAIYVLALRSKTLGLRHQQYGTLTCKIRLIQLRQSNNVQWDLLKIFAELLCRNATALRLGSFKRQAQNP